MSHPTRVYWDTGVYCGINRDEFQLLIAAEKRDSMTSFAHPHVVLELLCKIADWMDVKRYRSGLAGMKRLHQHCRGANGLRLLHSIERQAELTMFGHTFDPDALAEEMEVTTLTVDECATLDPAAWSRGTRRQIAEAADFKRRKVDFEIPRMIAAAQLAKRNAEKYGRQQGPIPWEMHIEPMLADRLVQMTAKTFGVELTAEENQRHNYNIYRTFSVAIRWEALTVVSAYDAGTAGPNNLWDAQILYGLSPALWENETPIVYVTTETKQRNALKDMAEQELLTLDMHKVARGVEAP